MVICTYTNVKAFLTGVFTLFLVCGTSALYASTYNYPTSELAISSEKDAEKIITNVKVFYNPIAEQVAVAFKLTKSGNVSIKVMDALGNEMLTLHNGNLEEGMQSLSFDTAGKLTTGFYFVRVSSGSETIIKRISIR